MAARLVPRRPRRRRPDRGRARAVVSARRAGAGQPISDGGLIRVTALSPCRASAGSTPTCSPGCGTRWCDARCREAAQRERGRTGTASTRRWSEGLKLTVDRCRRARNVLSKIPAGMQTEAKDAYWKIIRHRRPHHSARARWRGPRHQSRQQLTKGSGPWAVTGSDGSLRAVVRGCCSRVAVMAGVCFAGCVWSQGGCVRLGGCRLRWSTGWRTWPLPWGWASRA